MPLHQADLSVSRRARERIDLVALRDYLEGECDLADGLGLPSDDVRELRKQALALSKHGRHDACVDVVLGLVALGSIHPVDAVLLGRSFAALGRERLAAESDAHRARLWRTVAAGVPEDALEVLVEELEPAWRSESHEEWEEARRLCSAVESFWAFCRRLQDGSDLEATRRAIRAAGASEAVARFPVDQLALIEEKFNPAPAVVPRPLLRAEALETVEAAAAEIGRLLGDDSVAKPLAKASTTEAYRENLAAFALLIDQAASAPCYAWTRTGDFHPPTREGYRRREHGEMSVYLSEGRHEATHAEALRIVHRLVDSKNPTEDLERALVEGFVQEIGVHSAFAGSWQPRADAVREAIREEALFGLRALNETVQDMTERYPEKHDAFRAAVNDVLQAVLEGRLSTWRYDNPHSRRQLALLDPAQQVTWRTNHRTASTREVDGVELIWSTKEAFGGWFAFDRRPHGLLPVLANGGSKMILVEKAGAVTASARISVLERDGQPVLFLGPVALDWTHHPEATAENELMTHAIEKASQLGVSLSVEGSLAGHSPRALEREPSGSYLMQPSAGVVEISGIEEWLQESPRTLETNNRLSWRPLGGG